MLRNAQMGRDDFLGNDPTRRLTGLHNAVVFGRSVTLVLQTLRSVDAQYFDAWYAPYTREMESEPLFAWFRDLRNEILKEGAPEPTRELSANINLTSQQALMQAAGKPPPGAKHFFIGDQVGGSGWDVELADGTHEKYYVTLPEHMVKMSVTMHLPNPPTTYAGASLDDTSLNALLPIYLAYLSRVVRDAEKAFNSL